MDGKQYLPNFNNWYPVVLRIEGLQSIEIFNGVCTHFNGICNRVIFIKI